MIYDYKIKASTVKENRELNWFIKDPIYHDVKSFVSLEDAQEWIEYNKSLDKQFNTEINYKIFKFKRRD